FTIYKKLALGFGITIFAIVGSSFYTYFTLKKNIETIRGIANVYAPSEQNLHDMYFTISNSKMLIKNWVFIEIKSNTPNKRALIDLHKTTFPQIKRKLSPLVKCWNYSEQNKYNSIVRKIENGLFPKHQYIMNNLQQFDDYSNPMIIFEAQGMVEEENDEIMLISNKILSDLENLTKNISDKFEKGRIKMERSNSNFKTSVFTVGLLLILISIIIGVLMAHLIITPINKLKKATQEISRGNLDVYVSLNSNDEIQDLGDNFDIMTENLRTNQKQLQKANDKLRASQNKLEKANTTKNKFLSIIAHDLRAPFSAFVSVSEAMVNNFDMLSDNRKKSFANNINKSAIQLNELIENLLQWSQAQANNLEFNPEKTDIVKLTKQNISIASTQAESKKIYFTLESKDSVCAYFDMNHINTVLRNLISNALKYTPNNSKINIIIDDSPKNHVVINICDNGIGLTEKDISNLFRIDINTKYIGESTEKGTGLGLILCKEFVEINGGDIFVKSKINEGSIFSFTLPKKQ
ncbi:MAG: HAMP domain-containing sensor histidine kinase, partial [Bacteroidota bacterium]|nr:HAMP domain-containing sensor histidine kinase [Bacteroidota bacterium]